MDVFGPRIIVFIDIWYWDGDSFDSSDTLSDSLRILYDERRKSLPGGLKKTVMGPRLKGHNGLR